VEDLEQSNYVRLKFKDIFVVDNLFSEEEIKAAISDIDEGTFSGLLKVRSDLLGSINGKYAKKNNNRFVFYDNHTTLPKVSAILNLVGNATITLRINDKSYNLKAGSFIMFPSMFSFSIDVADEKYLVIVDAVYSDDRQIASEGSSKYTVLSTIHDEYSIDVYADSKEEAIEKASTINLSEWEHLDLYPELENRVITKFSKWGNFRVKE
jgi:hypothetical protein